MWLRYDPIRYIIFTCAQKLTESQLNLPHGTKNKTKRATKKLENEKTEMLCSEETVQCKVRGVSPEARRESVVEKICERGRF